MEQKEQKSRATVRIKELPEEERPREKLLQRGVRFLRTEELLTILIGTGSRELSAAALAGNVLSLGRDGLYELADLAPEEMAALPGIGKAKACRIAAAVELGRRIASSSREVQTSLCSSGDVAKLFMEEMRRMKKEVFRVLYLNTKNQILSVEDVSVGIINSSIVHPREVFRPAVKKSAYAVILLHNHPSGNPEPSRNDLEITARLVESGRILGIEVLDHLIIGDGIFVSLKDRSLM